MLFYISESLPISKHSWAVTKLSSLLKHTLLPCNAEFFQNLLFCWIFAKLITLLKSTCVITLLSFFLSQNKAQVFPILSNGTAIPNVKKNAVVYLVLIRSSKILKLKHCWSTPWPITLMNLIESHFIAEIYPTLIQCRVFPSLFKLMRYSQSHYNAVV